MRRSTHMARATLALLALAFASGCASQQPLEPRTLPYHVVVVPMAEPLVGTVSQGEFEGEATELVLNIRPEELTESVSDALREYCFADVTVLRAEDFADATDSYQLEAMVLERARELNADLVVELDLRYDAEVYRVKAGTYWLNYPLFLFAGPSNWFIGDNIYYADVDLTTSIYDLNVIEAGGFPLGDPSSRVMSASSRYTGKDLDFIDRSDGAGDYALGILIPSGFLSRESESTQQAVHDAIIGELRKQVVQGIQSRRDDLVHAEWIAPVYIEPEDVAIRREGDELVVEGAVHLVRNGLLDRVHVLRLEAGGEVVTVYPDPTTAQMTDEKSRVPFAVRVPVSHDRNDVRIECEAGARDCFVRSYTFSLPRD